MWSLHGGVTVRRYEEQRQIKTPGCQCLLVSFGRRYEVPRRGECAFVHTVLVVGKHLITIEGLGSVDNPHPLQERIAKLHGSQ